MIWRILPEQKYDGQESVFPALIFSLWLESLVRTPSGPHSSIVGMTRREVAILIIGISLGGLLASLAVALELLLSVPAQGWPRSSDIATIVFHGVGFFMPLAWVALLVAGLILAEYRKNSERISE
jgi:hypothetical protein